MTMLDKTAKLYECEECGVMTDDPQYMMTLAENIWALPEDCYPEEGVYLCPECYERANQEPPCREYDPDEGR